MTTMVDLCPIDNGAYYKWTRGSDYPIGAFFHTHEFTCPCGACIDQLISLELVNKLNQMRLWLGESIHINSGYRCPAHQAQLAASGYETAKGVSEHCLGNAADISTFPDLMHQLLIYCKQMFTSIGVATSFIHVDTRPLPPRSWSYKSL